MKKFFIAAAAMLCGVMCQAGNRTMTVNVASSFNSIEVSSNIEVEYTLGNKVDVRVTGDESVIGNISVDVRSKRLVIRYKGNDMNKSAKVFVTGPSLLCIDISGNVEFTVNGNMSAGPFTAKVHNNAELELVGINTADVDLEVGDNAEVSLGAVMCTALKVNASDNGKVHASSVIGNSIDVTSSDNSEIKLRQVAVSTLHASSSDNSNIDLEGCSAQVLFVSSDLSKIEAESLKANGGSARAGGMSHIVCRVAGLKLETSDFGNIRNL